MIMSKGWMSLHLAIAWLCGGHVGVLDLKWCEHDAEIKGWFWVFPVARG